MKRGIDLIYEVDVDEPGKMPEGIEAGLGIGAMIVGGGVLVVLMFLTLLLVKFVMGLF